MKLAVAVVIAAAAVVAVAPTAEACLWDYDTLKEEALGDREVAQVVKGELRKHSPAFYAAKVTYTRGLVDKGTAKAARYDDLAVALAKTGELDDAIAVLAAKAARFPGAYTTEANLGTFLAMEGDVAGALEHLKQAIAINPDAHLGREKFQIQLLEFHQRLATDPTLAEQQTFLGTPVGKAGDLVTRTKRDKKADKDVDAAVTAIVGLMRFGDGEASPHLWYALAWALVQRGDNQLAMFAFRRAEQLGHALAGADGSVRATVLKDLDTSPCCPDPGSDEARAAWAKATARIEATWKQGAAADARRQAAEDKRVAKRQWRAAFGY